MSTIFDLSVHTLYLKLFNMFNTSRDRYMVLTVIFFRLKIMNMIPLHIMHCILSFFKHTYDRYI